MLRVDRKNEFEDLFRVIDINGNGSLSREEMIKSETSNKCSYF